MICSSVAGFAARTNMPSESPILHFLRGTVLLTVLMAVPGIAVCWNHLPEISFFRNKLFQDKRETGEIPAESVFRNREIRSGEIIGNKQENAGLLPDPIALPDPIMPAAADSGIPPNSYTASYAVNPPAENPQTPRQENSTAEKTEPKNYETIKNDLNAMGVKYSKIEKWGNQGELFRFSCLVSVSDDSPCEKLFQDIGSNETEVMKSVIADIKRWRNSMQHDAKMNTNVRK